MKSNSDKNIELKAMPSSQANVMLCKGCTLDPLCHPNTLDKKTVDDLDSVFNRGVMYSKGEYIYHQGETFDAVYVVRSGSLKTYAITSGGEEQITNFYFATELTGLNGLNTKVYPVSAVALETTTVCKIPFSNVEELSLKLPELRENLYSTIGKELDSFQEMILTLSKKNAEERVATFLMNLSCRYKKRGFSASSFRLTMSRSEIGNFLGLAVETVSRVFSKFQKQSLIKAEGREIEILDPSRLAVMSGGMASEGAHAAQ
ncbi:MAG: fumarate/nitrate reduction transcriptional regulator Fnr [Pseudomonadales bacterium]|nr:fumarate/nitrate reduction transcriptional regulator Fnr [Pseudomonadales bacterium]